MFIAKYKRYIEEVQTIQWPNAKKKDQRTNNDLQNTTRNRTPLNSGGTQVLRKGKQFLYH